jgi:hypothetical protein
MTITQKVIVYIATLIMTLLWEVMCIAQMFRAEIGSPETYIVLALLGVGALLYIVHFVRKQPIDKG